MCFVDFVTLLHKFKYFLMDGYGTCSLYKFISDYGIHTSLHSEHMFLIIKPFNVIIIIILQLNEILFGLNMYKLTFSSIVNPVLLTSKILWFDDWIEWILHLIL